MNAQGRTSRTPALSHCVRRHAMERRFERALTRERLDIRFAIHPLDGSADELSGGFDLELVLDVRAVGFHRLDAEIEGVGDLAGPLPFSKRAEDFELAITELIDGGGSGLLTPPRKKGVQQLPVERLTQIHAAFEDAANGFQHL